MPEKRSVYDRIMSRKLEFWMVGLIIILLLIVMVLFGSLVQRQASREHDFGAIGKIAIKIASIPQDIKRSVRLAINGSHNDLKVEQRFEGLAGFNYGYPKNSDPAAGFLLLSRYDGDSRRSIVELIDLNKQEIVHRWAPDFSEINSRVSLSSNLTVVDSDNSPTRARIFHPLATDDGGLIFANMSPLVKVDACSKIQWIAQGLYHHTIEPSLDAGIWVPAFLEPQTLDNVAREFKEDALTHISLEGKILFQKSLAEILIENGLERLVFGLDFYSDDPTHLNDIEPVLFDGPYWRRGDLFLSLRSTATILLYRPSENRIVWLKQGPWSNQHDVDIVDEHRIAIFNNNRINRLNRHYVAGSNEVLVYDFATDQVTSPFGSAMIALDIRSVSEGRSQILTNGNIFIEESNFGRTLMLDPSGDVKWSHVNRATDGDIYLVSWSRYLSTEKGSALIRNVTDSGCLQSLLAQ